MRRVLMTAQPGCALAGRDLEGDAPSIACGRSQQGLCLLCVPLDSGHLTVGTGQAMHMHSKVGLDPMHLLTSWQGVLGH